MVGHRAEAARYGEFEEDRRFEEFRRTRRNRRRTTRDDEQPGYGRGAESEAELPRALFRSGSRRDHFGSYPGGHGARGRH